MLKEQTPKLPRLIQIQIGPSGTVIWGIDYEGRLWAGEGDLRSGIIWKRAKESVR